MSERTKKLRINKNKIYPKIKFAFGQQKYEFDNVSQNQILKAIEILSQSHDDTISAELLIKEALKSKDGVNAYKESAFYLKSLRERDNLSQLELSDKTGIAQSTLSSIENARRPVGKRLANIFANTFNVNYKIFLSDLPD